MTINQRGGFGVQGDASDFSGSSLLLSTYDGCVILVECYVKNLDGQTNIDKYRLATHMIL